MTMTATSRRELNLLKLSSALASVLGAGMLFGPSPAKAQILPVPGDVVTTAFSAGGNAPVVTNPTPTSLSVALDANATVIEWKRFDVPVGNTADFNSALLTPITVLNRVVGAGPPPPQSQILGSITSASNISVFLINPTGVLFGPDGSFSGGSLVLSTLNQTNADFLSGTSRFAGTSTNTINLQAGAGAINATNGSVVIIGQDLTSGKSISATRDVAFVAATDVSFPLGLGSPLSITVNAGTTLATAKVQMATGGAVTAQSVKIVGASQGGAIASLLNIDAGHTLTANVANGAVVIATQSNAANNITVSSPAAVNGITVGGALNATGAGGDIALSATGALTSTGTLVANDRVDATGGSVNLTSATATTGALSLNATAGSLVFPGGVTYNWATNLALTASQDVLFAPNLTSPGSITINAGQSAQGGNIESQTGFVNVLATTGLADLGNVKAATNLSIKAGQSITTLSGTATTGDIALDAGNNAILGNQTAGKSIAILGRAGNYADGGVLIAGEDIAVQTTGTTKFTSAQAGDDLSIQSGLTNMLEVGTTTNTGAGIDARRVDFSGPAIAFVAGELAAGIGANIDVTSTGVDVEGTTLTANGANNKIRLSAPNGTLKIGTVIAGAGATKTAVDQVIANARAIDITSATATNGNLLLQSTTGEVRLGTGTAGVNATVRANTNARVNTLTAQTGNLGIQAIGGDITGTAGGRTDLTASGLNALMTVTATGSASGTALLGTLAAGSGSTPLAGNQIVINASTVDLVSARAFNGDLQATSIVGDVIIRDRLVGNGNVVVNSLNNVRIADYNPGPETGFIRSASGNVTVQAVKSIFGLAGGAMPLVRGFGGIKTTGDLAITGSGDARINSLEAGGNLTINLAGSLTGTNGGAPVISGGGLFATSAGRSVAVTAGSAVGDIALLNRIEAGLNATVSTESFAIGQVKASTGLTTGRPASNFYVGLLDQVGNATLNFGGVPALLNASSVTSDFVLETGFGATTVTAGQFVSAAVGQNAQLGTVSAGTTATVQARGLTATSVTAAGGFVDLKATTGTLAVGTVNATTTATLNKLLGATATAGDDLRITGPLTAGTDATIFSNTHARVNDATATLGNLTVTGTLGNVTGVAGSRAKLTANGAGKDLEVTAAGLAFLGTTAAGRNLTVMAGNATTNGAIDADSATAGSGALLLSARGVGSNGDIRLGSGGAGMTATISNVDRGGTAGDIVVQTSMSAGGTILIDSARDATTSSLTAAGPGASLVTVRAVRNAVVGALDAKKDIAVTAGGSASVTSANADDDVDITAGTMVTINQNVVAGRLTATGDYRVTGGTGVVLGDNASRDQSATGVIDIKATTGNVSRGGTGALTLTANRDQTPGGEALTIKADTGSIILADTDLISGGPITRASDIVLTADQAGQVVRFGKADSDRLIISAGGDVSASGAINAGSLVRVADAVPLDPGKQTVDIISGGNVTLKAVSALGAGHDIDIRAAGTMVADGLNATGSVIVRAGGNINLSTGLVKAGEDVAIKSNGGTLTLANVEAGDDIDLQTAGAISLGGAKSLGTGPDTRSVTFPGTAIAAAFAPEPFNLIGGNIQISSGGLVTATGDLTAPRAITVTGQALDLANALAGAGNLTLQSTVGDVKIDTGSAGIAAMVTAAANARIGSLTGTVGGVTVAAGSGDVTGLVPLGAGANLTGNGPTSKVTVSALLGKVRLGTAAAGSGPSTLGADQIKVDARDIDIDTVIAANGNLALRATAGNVALGAGTAANGTATLTTTSNIGDVIVSTSLSSGGAATITSGRHARLAKVTAASGELKVTALSGEITGIGAGAADLTATTGKITVDAGTLARLGVVKAGGDIAVTGDNISVIEADAGSALTLIADAGSATLTTGKATGIATVSATGAATVTTTLTTNGAITLSAGGAATGGTLTSNASSVTVTGGSVNVTKAAANSALSITASNGGLTLGTGMAGTTADLKTTGGAGDVIVSTSLNSGGAATVTSVRDAQLASVKATTGDVKVTATSGQVTGVGAGAANLEATAGKVTVDASGVVRVGTVTAQSDVSVKGSAVTGALIKSNAATVTIAGASIDVGEANAKTALAITASNGNLTVGKGLAGTTADLKTTGGAGTVTVSTSLDAGGATTISSVGNARLALVKATSGDVKVTALSGEVTGIGAGSANLEATTGKVTVDAGTLARLGTVKAGGDIGVTGDVIAVADATTAQALRLVADAGGVTLGKGVVGTAAEIDASGLVTLSSTLTAGPTVKITGSDATIGGVVTAGKITIVNKSATANALRLGTDAGGAGGFKLSQTEIDNLNASDITLDAGTSVNLSQDIAIGAVEFGRSSAASQKVAILGLKRIDVSGKLSATGKLTDIRLGGATAADSRATVIAITPTPDYKGGIIDLSTANVDLRGDKIGVGLSQGFLEQLRLLNNQVPRDGADVAANFISQPNSSLYNSTFNGGTNYAAPGGVIFTARMLSVSVKDYALFQNTGAPGASTGVVLGSAASPIAGALTVRGGSIPAQANGFALFGTINGFQSSSAALLGGTIVSVTGVDPANTRVNGCIVGSGGGGCLVNVVSQPVLSVFDSSRADVFKSAADFEIPFDPVVGTNNESLFGDVGTFGLENIPITPQPECVGPDCPPKPEPKR
jgi:filamentous hemagglutinin family protein